MLGFCCKCLAAAGFVVSIMLAHEVEAQVERHKIWVGSHPYDNSDKMHTVADAVEIRLSRMEWEFEESSDLAQHFRIHDVKTDVGIKPSLSALELHYYIDGNNALLVMSGRGLGREERVFTQMYLGKPPDGFAVEHTATELGMVENYPSSLPYLRLILMYAIAREAHVQGRDFATYIEPLRERALTLISEVLDEEIGTPEKSVAREISDVLKLLRPNGGS